MARKQVKECFKEEDVINDVLRGCTLLKDQVSVDWEMTTGFGNMEG